MNKKNRWVLLKHLNAPDDIAGIHFDLLLEDGVVCRTWRLEAIPVINGRPVKVMSSSPHKLEWLDKTEVEVSGGRGWVSQLESGIFIGKLPHMQDQPVLIALKSKSLFGLLEIRNGFCRLLSEGRNI